MWIAKFAVFLVVAYSALIVLAYLLQTWMVFPAYLVRAAANTLPVEALRFTIPTGDDQRLAALRLPAREPAGSGRPLILGFGGNAWNAGTMVLLLHRLLAGHDVVAAHYRGYRPSSGRPSAAAVMADALTVYDNVAKPSGVIAVGFSIGCGIAAHLAAERSLTGLVLVTPFDSLTALARYHYPWAPVSLVLRHRIETAEALRRVQAPTAVITAERDKIVPAARSDPVLKAAEHLVYRMVVLGAGHNDLYDTPEFATALGQAIERIEQAGR